MEKELMKALINAGVGAMLAIMMLVGMYRIVRGLGSRFIDAEQKQAEALGAQAQALAGLTASVREYVRVDNSEHREMLVLLRFIAQEQRELEEVRIEHETRKKQTHPNCPARAT